MGVTAEEVTAVAPRRILYVEHSLDALVGGSHHSLLHLIKHLDRSRFEPLVAFYREHPMVSDFRRHGADVLFVDKPAATTVGARMRTHRGFAALGLPVLAGQKVRNAVVRVVMPALAHARLLRKRGVALVHLNNSLLHGQEWILAARLSGARCIVHQRGYGYGHPINRYLAHLVDVVVCISEDIQRDLQRRGVAPSRGFAAIHNGVDADDLRALGGTHEDTRRALGLDPHVPVIGIVGNIKAWKGQDVVVRAVRRLVDRHSGLQCLIIGGVSAEPQDRDYAEQLRALVAELGVGQHVHFTGYRADARHLISALDVLVHASVEPEPFGRVLIEGMAMATPVIAADLGGPREIVEHETSGLLVAAGDAAALAAALDRLLRDRSLAVRLGEAGRLRVEQCFGARRVAERIQQQYDRVLAGAAA